MPKLSREDCIQSLVKDYGKKTKTLEKMKTGELRQMLKDCQDKTRTKMAAGKDKEQAKAEAGKESAAEDKPATIEEKAKEEFASFCGSSYDPEPTATCEAQCSKENPNEHARCQEHFKATADAKPKSKTKLKARKTGGEVRKNAFGHRMGSQAAIIDQLLVEGQTIEAMAKELDTTTGRIRNHIEHLKRNGHSVFRGKENGYYYLDNPAL